MTVGKPRICLLRRFFLIGTVDFASALDDTEALYCLVIGIEPVATTRSNRARILNGVKRLKQPTESRIRR